MGSLLDALVNGRNICFGNGAPHNFVHKFVAFAPLQGLEFHPAVAELPVATGLLLVAPLYRNFFLEGFLVRDFRDLEVDLDIVFPLEFFHRGFDVYLPHAGDQRLADLLVPFKLEPGVFLHQFAERGKNLVLVPLAFR